MCYDVGGPLGSFSAKYINAKDIINIVPIQIGTEPKLMVKYYNHESHSEWSFFCDGVATELYENYIPEV